MTNNPTIDGVSRDTLKKWRRDLDACQRVIWLAGGFDPAYCTDAQECIAQMDSVLNAPVVERQESVEYPEGVAELLERSDWTPAEALAFYAQGNHFTISNGRTAIIDTGAVASNALKHASVEYLEMKGDAALSEAQSTIARLEARIADLESGRGEPVGYGGINALGGMMHNGGYLMVADKPERYLDVPLYKAPPAPVAAPTDLLQRLAYALSQVGKPDHMVDYDAVILAREDLNACLDATAALNGERK